MGSGGSSAQVVWQQPSSGRALDAVALEVLRHAVEGVAEEMNAALMRSAYSTNITDRRDSSCAIYLRSGEPVAQSESGTPLHLGVLPTVVKTVLKDTPPELMAPGDQYLMNTPYPEGPGHLNDLTLVAPVFYEDQLVALVANQAHHVDVGGMVPGSMPATSTEVFQEGIQIPPVALLRQGRVMEDVLSIFLANVRTPATSRGDLLAQVAANNVGSQRLLEVFERFGHDLVPEAMKRLLGLAERRMRVAISQLPDGSYEASDTLEGPAGPVAISVRVTVDDDLLSADFTGTDPQVEAPLNCKPNVVMACLAYVATALLDPGHAPNAGTLRPLAVTAPEGSLLNARFPASLVHSNIVTSQRICDVLLAALGQAMPDRAVAASSGTQSLVCIGGYDPEHDEPFTYIETHGGGAGASRHSDGQSGVHTHMTNTLNSPVEVLEQSFPFYVLEYGLEANSAGRGKFRGGFGMRKTFKTRSPATLTLAFDRVETAPWGLDGGRPAASARVELRTGDGSLVALAGRGTFSIAAGDEVTIVTPGGGGCGNPEERSPALAQRDRESELVTGKTT